MWQWLGLPVHQMPLEASYISLFILFYFLLLFFGREERSRAGSLADRVLVVPLSQGTATACTPAQVLHLHPLWGAHWHLYVFQV